MKSHESIVSHEIFHAYYFLNDLYRETVNRYWAQNMQKIDKQDVTAIIGKAYNIENESLVIDEFQAYLLQKNAEQDRMKTHVPKYQAGLLAELASQGIKLNIRD